MSLFPSRIAAFVLASLAALGVVDSHAAIQRTFVASTGSDVNPCTLAAPCRSFAAAIAQTPANSEVIVLDSAGYGPVSITQNVSIIAPPGVFAGISVPGPDPGVNVSGALVVLEGLTINGTGGTHGIRASGGMVYVTNCSVANFTVGIEIDGAVAVIHASELRDITFVGIQVSSGYVMATELRAVNAGSNAVVSIDNGYASIVDSVITGGGNGVSVGGGEGVTTLATIQRSVVAEMTANGAIVHAGTNSATTLDVLGSTFTRNAANGVLVTVGATVTVTDSKLTDNGYAIQAGPGSGAVALSNRNVISHNAMGGLRASGGGVLHTRGNNSGEQANATSGTTPVAGF